MKRKTSVKHMAHTMDYAKKNIQRLSFDLNKIHDQDILEFLETKESKAGYIKQLIRQDMANKKEN